jgi:orotate phosphoribosyltransferase
MQAITAIEQTLTEIKDRHAVLYDSPEVDRRLREIIREFPGSKLTSWDTLRILRTARAVLFDVHVEVVSGHHTATYLRFDSIARFPQLISIIARDMADWLHRRFERERVSGLVVTRSSAMLLGERVVDVLRHEYPLQLITTPYDEQTGRIGTDVDEGAIRSGERYVVLNDVTTRGNCVSKLATVVTDHGAIPAGMMVFARRDSGQFPLVQQLMSRHPLYFTVDVEMPQWAPEECPLCRNGRPLVSWKDMPEFSSGC